MSDKKDNEATAEEPEVIETPATDPDNAAPPEPTNEDTEVRTGIQILQDDYGVDVSSSEVQDAVLAGKSTEDIVKEFGTKEPEPKAVETPDDDPDVDPDADPDVEKEEEEEEAPSKPTGKQHKPDDDLPKRYRFTDEEDRRSVAAAKELGITLSEYFTLQREKAERAEKTVEAARQESAEPAEPAELKQLSESISAAETKATELKEQIEALEKESDEKTDEMEYAEARKIDRKATRLRDELHNLEIKRAREEDRLELRREQMAHESQTRWEAQKQSSVETALAKYPDLGDDGDRKVLLAWKGFRSDQPKETFQDPNWPEVLADKFAEEYGLEAKSPGGKAGGGKKPAVQRTDPGVTRTRKIATRNLDDGDGVQPPAKPKMTEERASEIFQRMRSLPPGERQKLEAQIFKGFGKHSPVLKR